eukprot:CAMPEP_0171910660 /NCGR_PEP_ID=MMETSP0993-20121228/9587_1 /TAXON_ID=483369 /ORGANISM="non described non described, Strain CCMP2098" /LENGTH=49 /DNA_ID=CAMNT_0012543885 /DNA_START=24 /DNA_END=173 /DNA_ORIENTATION=+
MTVGATHLELYVVGIVCIGVLVVLGFIMFDTVKLQSQRRGKLVRGEKLL